MLVLNALYRDNDVKSETKLRNLLRRLTKIYDEKHRLKQVGNFSTATIAFSTVLWRRSFAQLTIRSCSVISTALLYAKLS